MNIVHRSRLLRRFLVTFALVAAAVGVASQITGERNRTALPAGTPTTLASTSSTGFAVTSSSQRVPDTVGTVGAASPPMSVSGTSGSSTPGSSTSTTVHLDVTSKPLPQPHLDTYCAKLLGVGATAGAVDAAFNLTCRPTMPGAPVAALVDTVCTDEFGATSRRVSLSTSPLAARCIPSARIEVGHPDFDLYCRQVYGATARSSTVAADARGWRCAAVLHGIYVELSINYDVHEVDGICQATTGVESFADTVENVLGGWRCYGKA